MYQKTAACLPRGLTEIVPRYWDTFSASLVIVGWSWPTLIVTDFACAIAIVFRKNQNKIDGMVIKDRERHERPWMAVFS